MFTRSYVNTEKAGSQLEIKNSRLKNSDQVETMHKEKSFNFTARNDLYTEESLKQLKFGACIFFSFLVVRTPHVKCVVKSYRTLCVVFCCLFSVLADSFTLYGDFHREKAKLSFYNYLFTSSLVVLKLF